VCNLKDFSLESSSGMLPVVVSCSISGSSCKMALVLVLISDSWDCHEDTVL
jgi:hypothetical protein